MLIANNNGFQIANIPLKGSPSWVHTTWASSEPNASSQTVPQALLIQISTLPSSGLSPPINLSAPSLQLPARVVRSMVTKIQALLNIDRLQHNMIIFAELIFTKIAFIHSREHQTYKLHINQYYKFVKQVQ